MRISVVFFVGGSSVLPQLRVIILLVSFGLTNAPVQAQELIGVFATPTALESRYVGMLIEQEVGSLDRPLRGTELTPIYRSANARSPELSSAMASLDVEIGSDGYAILVSRFEHDVVEMTLLNGQRGYAVRVYLTFVADFFASRAAYSTENRLESIHTIPVVIARLYPNGELMARPPNDAEITAFYADAFSAGLMNLGGQASRDVQIQRRRASRLFEVAPIQIGERAIEYVVEIAGSGPESEAWALLQQELGYLLHSAIMAEIADRGIGDLAVVPPTTNWTIANVVAVLDAELGGRRSLTAGVENDGRGMIIRAEITRAATLEGEGNALGQHMFAASEVTGGVYSASDGSLRPASLPEEERAVSARGAGGFIALNGVNDPPSRGMWREGFQNAVEDLSVEVVERMTLIAEEIR